MTAEYKPMNEKENVTGCASRTGILLGIFVITLGIFTIAMLFIEDLIPTIPIGIILLATGPAFSLIWCNHCATGFDG